MSAPPVTPHVSALPPGPPQCPPKQRPPATCGALPVGAPTVSDPRKTLLPVSFSFLSFLPLCCQGPHSQYPTCWRDSPSVLPPQCPPPRLLPGRVALCPPEPCHLLPFTTHCLLSPHCPLPITVRAPVSLVTHLHLSSPYFFHGSPLPQSCLENACHGQRSLVGYSLQVTEWDTTEGPLLVPIHCPISSSITSPSHVSPSLMHCTGLVNVLAPSL